MINCYQPFRMSLDQSKAVERLCKKFNVNASWLIRYMLHEGMNTYDQDDLSETAKADPMSAPKKSRRVK